MRPLLFASIALVALVSAAPLPVERNPKFSNREAIAPGTRIGPYVTKELLGQGGFADVYRGELVDTKDPKFPPVAAIKCQSIEGGEGFHGTPRQTFDNEFSIQMRLTHPNILRAYGMFDAPVKNYRCAVLEFAPGKDLSKVVEAEPFSEDKLRQVFRGVVEALQYMHQQGVAHHDFKPENIAMVNGVAKILDFGLSMDLKAHPEYRTSSAPIGTERYNGGELGIMSPGVIDIRNNDVYSLGKTMWVALTGYTTRERGALTWKQWKWSPELEAMLRSMMVPEPQRATLDQILTNPWWQQRK